MALDRPRLMGVINATPDSFSDGGRHLTPAAAVAAALAMLDDGADLIDVGGESTRPGAAPIDPAEQVRRVVPVVAGILSARADALVEVDWNVLPHGLRYVFQNRFRRPVKIRRHCGRKQGARQPFDGSRFGDLRTLTCIGQVDRPQGASLAR